jgi:hypothetical protein
MPAGETSYAIRLRAVNSVGVAAAGNSESATSSAAAVSGLPFVDDFSTDTSADYTKISGDAALFVSGGVAGSDGTGNGNVTVMRDVGVGANHKVRVTVDNAASIVAVLAKVTDAGNEVRGLWIPSSSHFRLEKRVGGTYTNFGTSRNGQSFSSGNILELEIYNDGKMATLRRSTDGGVTFTDMVAAKDVSDVPSGSAVGFRVDGAATITEFFADNV